MVWCGVARPGGPSKHGVPARPGGTRGSRGNRQCPLKECLPPHLPRCFSAGRSSAGLEWNERGKGHGGRGRGGGGGHDEVNGRQRWNNDEQRLPPPLPARRPPPPAHQHWPLSLLSKCPAMLTAHTSSGRPLSGTGQCLYLLQLRHAGDGPHRQRSAAGGSGRVELRLNPSWPTHPLQNSGLKGSTNSSPHVAMRWHAELLPL